MDRFGSIILLGWGVVTASLFVAWLRNSLETTLLRRLAELHLWLFTVPLLLVGIAYATLGLAGFGAAGALYLITLALALGGLGRGLGARTAPVRSTSALLAVGSVLVWLGAVTWPGSALSNIAARPAAHTTTAALFLAGTLVTLAGLLGLRAILRGSGDEWLSRLGLASFQLGTAMWAVHLVFRITVTRPVAALTPVPPWFEPLRSWSGGLYAIYMVLAYLAIAAYGGALLRTGWVTRPWGRVLVGFGLVAAAGFLSPARGPFTPPLMVQFAPYAMSVLLLRKVIAGARQQRAAP